MKPDEVMRALSSCRDDLDLVGRLYELVDTWTAAGAGPEVVAPIIAFIEDHTDLDYGPRPPTRLGC